MRFFALALRLVTCSRGVGEMKRLLTLVALISINTSTHAGILPCDQGTSYGPYVSQAAAMDACVADKSSTDPLCPAAPGQSLKNCTVSGTKPNTVVYWTWAFMGTYTTIEHDYTYNTAPPDVPPTPEQQAWCSANAGSSSTKTYYDDTTSSAPNSVCSAIPLSAGIGGSCNYTINQSGEFPTKNAWAGTGTGTGTACNNSTAGVDTKVLTPNPTTTTAPTQTTSTSTTPTTTTTQPNGATTSTSTTTTTTTTGGKVTATDTSIIVTESGATVTKEVTTTTTTNPDGTKTVETTTTYTGYTQPTTTVTGTGTTTTPATVTNSGSTTVTNYYNTEGSITNTSTTNINGGAAAAQAANTTPQEQQQQQCGGPDQPKCQIDFGTAKTVPTDGQSIGDSTNSAWGRLKAAPIVQAMGGLSMPGAGTCPTASFLLFNHTFIMDAHCVIGEEIRGLFSALALAAWALLGLLIIASA